MNPSRLLHPTWRNGPAICDATMLPAHEMIADAKKFENSLPAYRCEKITLCNVCGGFHCYGKMRPPSGDSSGTGRR